MEIEFKDTRQRFHADNGAIVNVNRLKVASEDYEFYCVELVDGNSNRLSIYLDVDQTADLVERLTKLAAKS